jgi:hypothetical protein
VSPWRSSTLAIEVSPQSPVEPNGEALVEGSTGGGVLPAPRCGQDLRREPGESTGLLTPPARQWSDEAVEPHEAVMMASSAVVALCTVVNTAVVLKKRTV